MPTKSKSTKRRTKSGVLTPKEKALSKAEQKKVKGGYLGGVLVAQGVRVAVGDVTGDNIITGAGPGKHLKE